MLVFSAEIGIAGNEDSTFMTTVSLKLEMEL